MIKITSRANNLIKQTKKLHQKKHRTHAYLIEGWHLVEEAEKSGASFNHVFATEDYAQAVAHLPNVIIVSEEVLADLAQSPSPQGVVAEIGYNVPVLPDISQGRYLVLEDVQDPGNLGTLIRTADAAGFDAVFISDKSADIYNAKTLRSMQGSHFHLPVIRCDIAELIDKAKILKTPVLATTLSSESVDYQMVDKSSRFLLVMGNEGKGISQVVADKADKLVHITMPGQAESLNVAVAGGILMFYFM